MKTQTKANHVTDIARLFPQQGYWTEDDYLYLPDSNEIVELYDGNLIMPPPPAYRHQHVVGELFFRLKAFAQNHNLGRVAIAPLAIRLGEGHIREPDVMFFSTAHLDRIGEQVSGIPDWVAEVVSPGSRKTDEVIKLAEYAKAGISEYWLVDPDDKSVRVYVLEDEVYRLEARYEGGATAQSKTVDGFVVVVAKLFV